MATLGQVVTMRTKRKIAILAGVLLALFLLIVLAGDLAWCADNYGVDLTAGHCLAVENSLFGRFIHP